MRTDEATLSDYLAAEAERVVVYDSLDDIEADVAHLVVTDPATPTRRLAPLAALAAVTLAVVAATLVVDARRSTPDTSAFGSPIDEPVAEPVGVPIDSVPPPDGSLPDTFVASVPLPAGGTVQGFTPSCTTLDGSEYHCEIPDYPTPAGFDRTGEIQVIVDDTGHLSGGCRAAAPDGTAWTCYVGRRSIDEGVVHPPTLGQPWQAGWADG